VLEGRRGTVGTGGIRNPPSALLIDQGRLDGQASYDTKAFAIVSVLQASGTYGQKSAGMHYLATILCEDHV
jgi:hypothetical protein